MKFSKLFLIVLLFVSFQVCLAQPETQFLDGDDNWVKQYGLYSERFITLRYDRYSKEDTAKFREKLDLMKYAKFRGEWDGIYYVGYEETVLHSELRIASDIGFVDFSIYSCLPELSTIDYGKILITNDFIQLFPEFAENSRRKSQPIKYIKVTWGDKYLLVEESSLSDFAEKAVGIYVEPEEDSINYGMGWRNFWVKGTPNSYNELTKEIEYVGLPEFPLTYKKFQRLPIETKIVSVGKRTVEKDKVIGNSVYSEAAFYEVTIAAGKNKGVKKGMYFEIPEIENQVFITKVNQNNSIGILVQMIDENKNDECFGEDSNRTPCPKIKPSLKVKTKIGYFWF